MSQETIEQSPALTASQASWRCVQAKDKEGWLALMTDDVVIEDPIGPSYTNPDGTGVRGKEGVSECCEKSVGLATITITCEETFPSSSPDEIAHILQLLLHVRQRRGERRAGHLHLQGQRRRPADQPARLLEHGHDEARQGGQARLALRCPGTAPSWSAVHAASGSRSPNFSPHTVPASWSTAATPMRPPKRREGIDGAVAYPGSAADPAIADALIDTCISEFGRIDILVNCAGTAGLASESILNVTSAQFRDLLDAPSRHDVRDLPRRGAEDGGAGGGAIINTSSFAFLGDYGGTGYPAGKGGVNGLTLAIAADLREHGVRANVVCPGAKTRLSTGKEYEDHIVGLNRRGQFERRKHTGGTRRAPTGVRGTDLQLPRQ